jgi:hypothetical protein
MNEVSSVSKIIGFFIFFSLKRRETTAQTLVLNYQSPISFDVKIHKCTLFSSIFVSRFHVCNSK